MIHTSITVGAIKNNIEIALNLINQQTNKNIVKIEKKNEITLRKFHAGFFIQWSIDEFP